MDTHLKMSKEIIQCETETGWECCNETFKFHKDITFHMFSHFTITTCVKCGAWHSNSLSLLLNHHSSSRICNYHEFVRFDKNHWFYATLMYSQLPEIFPSPSKLH